MDYVGGTEVTDAVAALAFTRPGDSFAEVNGAPYFDWMEQHPDRWSVFDAAMAAGAQMHDMALDVSLDLECAAGLCDVGGGTGELARTLLDLHPGWSATVYDLPEVVDRAVEHLRLDTIGGDAFASIPDGYSAYLFVNVLHDWGDNDCRTPPLHIRRGSA